MAAEPLVAQMHADLAEARARLARAVAMIETERLRLRRWELRDRAPFAALNADPAVTRYLARSMTRAESDGLVTRIEDSWQTEGIGFAVAERRSDGVFLGMVGLARLRFPELGPPFDGALEVGWRLARAHWGQGYATEAARGWLAHGFRTLDAPEIVAITAVPNLPSQAVMRRLGMGPDPERGFDHPRLPEGHPLRPHLLFAIGRESWDGFDLPPRRGLR